MLYGRHKRSRHTNLRFARYISAHLAQLASNNSNSNNKLLAGRAVTSCIEILSTSKSDFDSFMGAQTVL